MEHIAKTIDVDRPVGMVYNQWTQVEEFPRFMDGITEVRQLDATHVHWRATISSKDKEWDAEITEQVPDEGIAWRSVSGNAPHADAVRFEPLADGRTRVHLVIAYEYIESRGIEDGAWRGTVHECAVQPSPSRERS